MEDSGEYRSPRIGLSLLRALRPALPAVIGASALTFLFAAVMPMAWVAAISWNLYLDRLAALFVPPIGNGARLALALGLAAVAALIAGLVALLIARPDAVGIGSLRRKWRGEADADVYLADLPPRRRADFHPDDPPRPPIRAGRDLPAAGLGPLPVAGGMDEPVEEPGNEFALDYPERAEVDEEEFMLADLAPPTEATGGEPWLQPAEIPPGAAPLPNPADKSLGAMVARFEAGLVYRRGKQDMVEPAASAPGSAAAVGSPGNEDDRAAVDFALEAALGTLSRMNRQVVG